jgi:pro-kumamolisin-like protein/IPT/TIG domain-containing protein
MVASLRTNSELHRSGPAKGQHSLLRGVARTASLTGLLVAGVASALPASAAIAAKPAAGPPRLERIQARPVVPAGARATGAVAVSALVSGEVVLKPRDNAALTRFIAQVSDPGSAQFQHYLPAGAFASRFGPAKAQIDAVRSRLAADGLRIGALSRDGLILHFTGTARAVESAFRTGLESYRLADGAKAQATTSAIRLPSAIASAVTAVLGLNTLLRIAPIGVLHPPASAKGKIKAPGKPSFAHPKGAPDACPQATAAATEFGGLTDDQIAHSYGAFGLYRDGDFGAGQHIALYELEPFARSDLKTFDTCYFGSSAAAKMLSRVKVIKVDGGQPAGPGSGEANLDVEDISAIAPGASLDVYEGASPGSDGVIYDPVDPYAAMINTDHDQIISTSWGLCEQAVQQGQPGLQQAENALFEQAAAQGQSIFSASGDNGSDDCNTNETTTPVAGQNPLSVDDPSSQPYVVAVGGTSIDDATQPPLEQVWNDGALDGADGGGISESWTMPAWQRQATVPGLALPGSSAYTNANKVEKSFGYPSNFCQSTVPGANISTPCRLLPDVSAQADEFTGGITVYEAVFGGWNTTGGTSSAAPIWAAVLALANASPACAANPATRGHGVGFVNPLLYAVASVPADYARSFTDVKLGNNDIYGLRNGAVYPATKDYDLATGLGSPELTDSDGGDGLAFNLCHLAQPADRPAVTGISPAFGSVNGGESITISGSGFETGSTPDVAELQIGGAQLSAAKFHVVDAHTITATVPPASQALPPVAPGPQNGAGPANVIVTLKTTDATSATGSASVFQYVNIGVTHQVTPGVTGVVPVAGSQSAPGKTTILGSGFTGATSVTFGGVPATSFTVLNSNVITATPPSYTAHPACAPLPATGVYAGENAANDICQVQVRVFNSHGGSPIAAIKPPDEGAITLNSLGVLVPPAGCGCEIQQAPTEYDYAPTPTITSISTSTGAANLASERGGTLITVHGTGLDPLTIDWADFGPAASGNSVVTNFVSMTGTEMQVIAPGEALTTDRVRLPFSVKSLAGQSGSLPVSYAGLPKVTSVDVARGRKLDGIGGAADTGGTPIKISGRGFSGQLIAPVEFTDSRSPFSLGTQYSLTVASDTAVATQTVGQNPALVDVQLCTATGCSKTSKADRLYLYPPGIARVGSVTPASGPAAGGTKVTISGGNLGCPLAVFFGKVKAKSVTPVQALLDCASTTAVRAVSPKGKAGSKVPVSVETFEGFFTGGGHGTTSAKFTYR